MQRPNHIRYYYPVGFIGGWQYKDIIHKALLHKYGLTMLPVIAALLYLKCYCIFECHPCFPQDVALRLGSWFQWVMYHTPSIIQNQATQLITSLTCH